MRARAACLGFRRRARVANRRQTTTRVARAHGVRRRARLAGARTRARRVPRRRPRRRRGARRRARRRTDRERRARGVDGARRRGGARARGVAPRGALAATANARWPSRTTIAGSVSELEDEDGATAKLERASASAASAAATFRTLASEDGADGARARAMIGERGQLTCDGVRDAAWGGLRARLAASGWPPGLRPTELRACGWSLARDGGEDDDADAALGEMRAVRAFHVLRATSEARSGVRGGGVVRARRRRVGVCGGLSRSLARDVRHARIVERSEETRAVIRVREGVDDQDADVGARRARSRGFRRRAKNRRGDDSTLLVAVASRRFGRHSNARVRRVRGERRTVVVARRRRVSRV